MNVHNRSITNRFNYEIIRNNMGFRKKSLMKKRNESLDYDFNTMGLT